MLIGLGAGVPAEEPPPPEGGQEQGPAAGGDGTSTTLPEVVVTATRDQAAQDRVPYTTHVLDEDSLRLRLAPRSLPEALQETPGVSAQKTASGLESPYLRGFTGFRTLLLVDGIRLNNAVFREGPNQYWGTVDPLAIHRMEAVMGPSSVLYGSDAIGGTVNALTLDEFPAGHHPGLYYRYASAEDGHTVRGDVRGLAGALGYSGGVTWRDFGDIVAGKHVGLQEDTGYDALAGDAKVAWRPAPSWTLTAAHQSFDQDRTSRTHATTDGISYRGTDVGTDRNRDLDQERALTYARAEYRPEARWLESASLTLSHHLQREREDRIRSNGRRTRQSFDDHSLGAQLAALTPSPAGDWSWGAEYYLDLVDSTRNEYDAGGALSAEGLRGPVADNSLYGMLGVFIQDRIQPAEWVEIIAGGRYNHIHAQADDGDIDPDPADAIAFDDLSEDWDALVGSGRAIFHPIEWLSPFAGVSQGFRAPNLSDLTRFDIARSGEVETPATDLDPEYFLTYEGGLILRGARWRFQGAYYYTDVRDLITRFRTGDVIDGLPEVTRDNIGDGHVHGVDLWGEWDFVDLEERGRFSIFGNFTWVEGEIDAMNDAGDIEDAYIDKGQPTSFLAGLRWRHATRPTWIEATYRHVLRQDHLSPGDKLDTQRIPPGGTPGYHLLGIRGSWSVIDSLRLFAGVENITDSDYRVHGSGVNGPGTSFVGGLDARW
jgi:hemoglobin/transferrin/lactoferrin receptor protein